MTKREVLTNLVGAYICANNELPKLNINGNLSRRWLDLVDAICNATPEDEK